MIADCVVLAAFHFIERGMQAEKKLREMEAAHEVQVAKESGKAHTRAEKNAVREQQKQAQRMQKHQSNGVGKKHNIQQPSKHD